MKKALDYLSYVFIVPLIVVLLPFALPVVAVVALAQLFNEDPPE